MKILGVVGSVFGSKTKIALNTLNFEEDIIYDLLDLADYKLPFADGRVLLDYDEDTIKVVQKIIEADAIIFGTPVYQASISGALKNLFDLLPVDTLLNKVVGIIVTAGSAHHYLMAEHQLIPILNYLKADTIAKYVYITAESFYKEEITDDGILIRLERLSQTITERLKYRLEQAKKFDF